jgi:hypothetical protein
MEGELEWRRGGCETQREDGGEGTPGEGLGLKGQCIVKCKVSADLFDIHTMETEVLDNIVHHIYL